MQINNMNQNYMNKIQLKTTFNDDRIDSKLPEKVDKTSISKKDINTAAAALSLTGSDLFKAKPTYSKNDVSAVQKINEAPKVEKLQDFDLSPVKKSDEVTAIKGMEAISQTQNQDKVIISDPEMDNFLKNAFKVFDLNY